MAQDIVGGLFGIQQQPDYYNQDYQTAVALANANDSRQMGRFLGGMIGAPLGRAVAQGVGGLLGVQDPRLQQASIIREAQQQGFDVTSPEGLQQLAQFFVQRGQPGLASQVAQQAMTQQQTMATTRRTEALANREEARSAKLDMMERELQALSPDASEEQILSIVTKYGDADTILKEYNRKIEKRDKLASEGGALASGNPGSVGKGGAYRDINGQIWGAGEMKDYRSEFETAQKIMSDLNSVTPSDVANAQSRIVTPGSWSITKQVVGNEKMRSAQSKLAATQLLQQINNLPKGSASDADMKKAAEQFPGWDDEVALAKWVNQTKKVLQDRITRMSEQFGWTPKTTNTGYIDVDGSGRSLEGFVTKEQQTTTQPQGQQKVRRWNPQTSQFE